MADNPNTATFPYLSSVAEGEPCHDENKKIEETCKEPAKNISRNTKAPIAKDWLKGKYTQVKRGVIGQLKDDAEGNYTYVKTPENKWVNDHCTGLWVKPRGEEIPKFDALIGTADEVKSLFPGKGRRKNYGKTGAWGDLMKGLATANPCITARRCALKPYNATSSPGDQANSGAGCCPGQTGHHVIPGAMFKKNAGKNRCAKPYVHGNAPVICVEGADNSAGTHGIAHTELDALIDTYKAQNTNNKHIEYETARDLSIEAVRKVNPDCTVECLKAQLDAHYQTVLGCEDDTELLTNSGKARSGGTDAAPPPPAQTSGTGGNAI